MSREAYCLAIVDRLRVAVISGGLGFDKDTCNVAPDARVPAMSGKEFVAVYAGDEKGVQEGCQEDEVYFYVAVFRRVNEPMDRLGREETLKLFTGLAARARRVRNDLIENEYAVMNAANAYRNTEFGTTVDGYCEPAWYKADRGPEWVPPSALEADADMENYCAMRVILQFGPARLIQNKLQVR